MAAPPAAPTWDIGMVYSLVVPAAAFFVASQLDGSDAWTLWAVRTLWLAAAAADVLVLLRCYFKIRARRDAAILAYFPAAAMRRRGGPHPNDAVLTTNAQYDMERWRALAGYHALGQLFCWASHAWLLSPAGALTPLCIGIASTPLSLLDAPLVRIHILGQRGAGVARPFGAPETLVSSQAWAPRTA